MSEAAPSIDPAATDRRRAVKRMKFRMAHAAITVCRALPRRVLRNVAAFAQSLEFADWVLREFGAQSRFVSTRERLWSRMREAMVPDGETVALEFGVAYGYATRWWLEHVEGISRWHGFDTFSGLPEAWRHFPAGAFDADGRPPEIDDSRVSWVVGRVEETVTRDVVRAALFDGAGDRRPCLCLLDLDLYVPTRHVISVLAEELQAGDILYFDEAADLDERRVLLELMKTMDHELELIAASPVGLALRVAAGGAGE
jgi:hypothetical protein